MRPKKKPHTQKIPPPKKLPKTALKIPFKSRRQKFLEKHNLLRLNQEEIENINIPITSTEIETVIKVFQQTKVPDQMASQANSIKYLEKS